MKDQAHLLWTILIIYIGIGPVNPQLITSQLYTDLFITNNYNTNLLPVCQNGGNVTVKLNTALRQVMDVVSYLSISSFVFLILKTPYSI